MVTDSDSRESEAVPSEGDETGDEERIDAHLDDVPVGAGCTEIWEHLSENRNRKTDERDDGG